MKKFPKLILGAVLATSICFPAFAKTAMATTTVDAASYFSTTATGYDSADDVKYVTAGGYTVNWGAREETCTFLSSRATAFYTGNNTFENLSKNAGGSSQSNAPSSALYTALKSFMTSKHTYINAYKANNNLLKYTDCVSSNYSKISSFYSGIVLNGEWDSAATWNKEHTWPNSKGLGGSDEDDIMMIRPTSVSENSSRGNTAYGQSSSYYDPNGLGANVRGDCARIVLYTYTRWGNTSYMWGTSGVMENLNVLLQWMEEDPVDTWEMGRNDAVQSITGTRNVFIDYPEFAWLLFGRSAPTDMPTPSGIANGGTITGGGNGGTTNPDDGDDNTGSGDSGTTTPDLSTPAGIIAAAQALGSGQSLAGTHTLTGTVTEIKQADTTTNNVQLYMEIEGFSMYCFWLQNAADKVKVGDTITVSGTIKNYNGTIEYEKPTLVSVNNNGGTTNPDDGNDNTDDTTYTSIATLHTSAAGTNATAKGVVTAVGKAGFTFNDGTGTMYFYTNKTVPTVKVGDEVEVSGPTSSFGGKIQFSSTNATYTKKDVDVPKYTAPTPTTWDGADLDALTDSSLKVGEYIKITADISSSGTYFNGSVAGASKNQLSLVSPSDDVLGSITLSSTPQTLVITGYTCYLSGGKYVYVIVTSISLPGEDVEEENPTNPDDGNGGNTGNEEEKPTDPPCEMPVDPEPEIPNDITASLGMDCSGSITGGLTVLSVAIGAVALLLKKKED